MSLRVAFDLDGTLADMEQVLRREATSMFGAPPSTGSRPVDGADMPPAASDGAVAQAVETPGPPGIDLTSRQWARLWAHVGRTEDFWLSLPEIDEGIVEHIAGIAARRRWDVLFITTRPRVRGQTTQLQTQKWLETHGFPLPSVYVVQRSRGLIAQALELDAVVDDRLENAVDVALESKAMPILIRPARPPAVGHESRPVGVRVVSSIREAVAVLEQLDDERRQPGVVRSIRKWLGR
jgi:hypothetical protein